MRNVEFIIVYRVVLTFKLCLFTENLLFYSTEKSYRLKTIPKRKPSVGDSLGKFLMHSI